MTLYEGIALIQEKQAVVLDLGYDYTKFGFAGEPAPRCIIRSEFWSTSERRVKRVFDYKDNDELYDNLVHMLHQLYFRHVLVNPKERRVVVVESLLAPTALRHTLAAVLYNHYEVCAVRWAASARLAAAALPATTALVVDLGARDAEVTPVVHGWPVVAAIQSVPLGARTLHAELAALLDRDNEPAAPLQLPDHVLEDIKVKTCFVGSRERALQWERGDEPPSRAVMYSVGGAGAGGAGGAGAVRVSGRARELAAQVMFSRDNDAASLPDVVLQAIMQSPIDARRPLAESVVVVGGGARLPGLVARLRAELLHLLTQPPYSEKIHIKEFKFHEPPTHANMVCWVGGAAAGAVGAAGARAGGVGGAGAGVGAGAAGAGRCVPRDEWARRRRLPDWACLLTNTPPDHYMRADL